MTLDFKSFLEIAAALITLLTLYKQLKDLRVSWEDLIRQQVTRDEQLKERLQRIEERLDGVDDRLEEHNNYGEKFVKNSEEINGIKLVLTEIKTDLKWIVDNVKGEKSK